MKKDIIRRKRITLCTAVIMSLNLFATVPAFADTADDADIISDVTVPENGVIQYDVTVPAGSTVNYEVELTPDVKTGTIDSVAGMWKNTTRKTVTKTITAKVKFLSNEYTIHASYTSSSSKQKIEHKDQATAVRSYEEETTNTHLSWNAEGFEKWHSKYEEQRDYVSEQIKKLYGHIK